MRPATLVFCTVEAAAVGMNVADLPFGIPRKLRRFQSALNFSKAVGSGAPMTAKLQPTFNETAS